jgi:hypothetical protein
MLGVIEIFFLSTGVIGGSEVFRVVTMKYAIFWYVTSSFFRNLDALLPAFKVSRSKRQYSLQRCNFLFLNFLLIVKTRYNIILWH